MLFCREVPALSLSQSHGTVNAARLDPAAPCLSSTFSSMSDESEDYDSDGSDCIDSLVDAYRNMQNMFDARPFERYDATFDAYDANNANLDAAVATWWAALNNVHLADGSLVRLAAGNRLTLTRTGYRPARALQMPGAGSPAHAELAGAPLSTGVHRADLGSQAQPT